MPINLGEAAHTYTSRTREPKARGRSGVQVSSRPGPATVREPVSCLQKKVSIKPKANDTFKPNTSVNSV